MNTKEFKQLLAGCVRHSHTDEAGVLRIEWRRSEDPESELVALGQFRDQRGVVSTALDHVKCGGGYFRASNTFSRDFLDLGAMPRPLEPAR